MVKPTSNDTIRRTAKQLFAQRGYDGVSMRVLAKESGVGLSSIYHFFADKDELLKAIYTETNTRLGVERKAMALKPSFELALVQLIDFQFDHMEDVVFVLKYYMHYRQDFAALPTKTLPPKSTLHVEEILQQAVDNGEMKLSQNMLERQARIIAHTINGFLLEFYPDMPDASERRTIANDIVSFSI